MALPKSYALKDTDRIANSVDPDQRSSQIWVYTDCPDVYVRKRSIITVAWTWLLYLFNIYPTNIGIYQIDVSATRIPLFWNEKLHTLSRKN